MEITNDKGDIYQVEKIGPAWRIKIYNQYYKAWMPSVGEYRTQQEALAAARERAAERVG